MPGDVLCPLQCIAAQLVRLVVEFVTEALFDKVQAIFDHYPSRGWIGRGVFRFDAIYSQLVEGKVQPRDG